MKTLPPARRPGSHYCHARGCEQEVSPRLLMCPWHWKMVPFLLRAEVWKHYRAGQEKDKQPSTAYLQAATNAINAVAAKEGR